MERVLALVVAYLVVLKGSGLLIAIDVDGDSAIPTVEVALRNFILPIGLSGLFGVAVVTWLGWWPQVIRDHHPVQRWVWFVPIFMIVVALLSFNYGHLGDQTAGLVLALLGVGLVIGVSEELWFRFTAQRLPPGRLLRGLRGAVVVGHLRRGPHRERIRRRAASDRAGADRLHVRLDCSPAAIRGHYEFLANLDTPVFATAIRHVDPVVVPPTRVPTVVPTPAPTATPTLRGTVSVRTTRLVAKRGKVKLRLACSSRGPCSGRLTVRAGSKTLVRSRSYSLAAGQTRTYTLAIRRTRATKVRVTLTPTTGRPVTKTIRLRSP